MEFQRLCEPLQASHGARRHDCHDEFRRFGVDLAVSHESIAGLQIRVPRRPVPTESRHRPRRDSQVLFHRHQQGASESTGFEDV